MADSVTDGWGKVYRFKTAVKNRAWIGHSEFKYRRATVPVPVPAPPQPLQAHAAAIAEAKANRAKKRARTDIPLAECPQCNRLFVAPPVRPEGAPMNGDGMPLLICSRCTPTD